MTPADGGYSAGYTLLRITFITAALSAVHVYNPSQNPIFKPAISLPQCTKNEIQVVTNKILPLKKTIYLSFDDGPNAGTRKVVDILHKENIPATLFIVGEHTKGSALQARMFAELQQDSLIELANHSYTHALHNQYALYYSDADTTLHDFKQCTDSLQLKNKICRTPGRNIWRTKNIDATDLKLSKEAADSLYANGYSVVGWDVEWHFDTAGSLVQSDSLVAMEMVEVLEKNRSKPKTNWFCWRTTGVLHILKIAWHSINLSDILSSTILFTNFLL